MDSTSICIVKLWLGGVFYFILFYFHHLRSDSFELLFWVRFRTKIMLDYCCFHSLPKWKLYGKIFELESIWKTVPFEFLSEISWIFHLTDCILFFFHCARTGVRLLVRSQKTICACLNRLTNFFFRECIMYIYLQISEFSPLSEIFSGHKKKTRIENLLYFSFSIQTKKRTD